MVFIDLSALQISSQPDDNETVFGHWKSKRVLMHANFELSIKI